jgi:ABC-type glycerol-3-phosphate transport system substrate-binding protein
MTKEKIMEYFTRNKIMRKSITFFVVVLLLAGCANISSLLSTPEPESTLDGTAVPTNTATPITTSPTVDASQITPDGSQILRIWILPQFDPATESPASTLFQERLDEFAASRPGLQIEVRVKAEGVVNLLSTTQAAAPAIMPDLVALTRTDLEAAAAQGLLHPMDGLTTLLDDPDWYPYAFQMAHIQNTTFGLPFAGDALALIGYNYPLPMTWNELPEETLFVFPAADPQGLFSLSLYLSAGGVLTDDQGLPTIDETTLANVLSLYLPPEEDNEGDSDKTQFFSPVSGEFQNDEQSWNAFREGRGNLTVSWVSRYLEDDEQSSTMYLAPLPGLETGQYTLATGWSWALAGSNSENQALAVELAEFLSDSLFLAKWNQATGYLPTRPTALSSWDDAQFKLGLAQTAESAHLMPSDEVRLIFGPLFVEATLSVLSGEQLPAEAAQSVAEELK